MKNLLFTSIFLGIVSLFINNKILAMPETKALCPLEKWVFENIDDPTFKLNFATYTPYVSGLGVIISHPKRGNFSNLIFGCSNGYGDCWLQPLENQDFSGIISVNFYDKNLKTVIISDDKEPPEIMSIHGLGSYDWYWLDQGRDDNVGNSLWRFQKCRQEQIIIPESK